MGKSAENHQGNVTELSGNFTVYVFTLGHFLIHLVSEH